MIMNVGCVPVDKSIIQLEFQHEVAQSALDSRAGFLSTIGTGRKNAQSIRSTAIHDGLEGE